MTLIPVRIPQIGEGLLEARIISLLCPAGAPVTRDRPILEIETDKATIEIEAPASGILEQWKANEGSIIPVGSIVATIRTNGTDAKTDNAAANGLSGRPAAELPRVEASAVAENEISGPAVTVPYLSDVPPANDARNHRFSPRVRAYCREHNISDEELRMIPSRRPDGRLQIDEVERWLLNGRPLRYQDRLLSPRQRSMAEGLSRAWQQVVPASIEIEFNWDAVQQAKPLVQAAMENDSSASSLDLIAWCVTCTMQGHPKLRSAWMGGGALREYRHVQLGIAVALPDDELTVAVLPDADTLPLTEFVERLHRSVHEARTSSTLAPIAAQLTISKLSSYGIRSAQAVVVPPSIATLVIGAPYPSPSPAADGGIRWTQRARLILTFDHRILNGAGAAAFLQDVQGRIERLCDDLNTPAAQRPSGVGATDCPLTWPDACT